MKTHATTAPDDVSAALRLLAESLEEEEKRIRNEGSKAMNEGDYDTATAVIDFAKRLLAFQKKVAGLEKEWDDLEDLRDKATPAVQEIVSKRFFGRLKSGEITHLRATLNAPSHPIRNRLLRLTADSPDLLAIIKEEGRVK